MPSVSKKQHNFMQAIAHSPDFAKKVGVPQSVGKDFATADKGKKFKEGGTMKKMKKFADGGPMIDENETEGGAYVGNKLNMGKTRGSRLGRVSKEDSDMLMKQDAESGMNKNPRMGGLARAGMSAGMSAGLGSKYGMKKGGMAHEEKGEMKKDLAQDKKMIKKAVGMHDKQQHGGKKTNLTKLAKGGSFRSSADGCATKGKTKGTQIKMKMGGAC
jgi:hypothetical protein